MTLCRFGKLQAYRRLLHDRLLKHTASRSNIRQTLGSLPASLRLVLPLMPG